MQFAYVSVYYYVCFMVFVNCLVNEFVIPLGVGGSRFVPECFDVVERFIMVSSMNSRTIVSILHFGIDHIFILHICMLKLIEP